MLHSHTQRFFLRHAKRMAGLSHQQFSSTSGGAANGGGGGGGFYYAQSAIAGVTAAALLCMTEDNRYDYNGIIGGSNKTLMECCKCKSKKKKDQEPDEEPESEDVIATASMGGLGLGWSGPIPVKKKKKENENEKKEETEESQSKQSEEEPVQKYYTVPQTQTTSYGPPDLYYNLPDEILERDQKEGVIKELHNMEHLEAVTHHHKSSKEQQHQRIPSIMKHPHDEEKSTWDQDQDQQPQVSKKRSPRSPPPKPKTKPVKVSKSKEFLQRINSIMQKPHEELDWEQSKEDQQQAANTSASSDFEDDDESEEYDLSQQVPSYINQRFAKELGGSLSHHMTHKVSHPEAQHLLRNVASYPIEHAQLTTPPNVPPPITRKHPVKLVVDFVCSNKKMKISGNTKFEYWPFGYYDEVSRKHKYCVPGPFIRARVGDVLQLNFTNLDESGMAHSIDFHSVMGPGGGSPATFAEQDETKVGAFLLQKPGLYVYHCAAAPIPLHIHNGMFGLILVEPTEGLPPVDKEFYVMQHELYLEENDDDDDNVDEYEYDETAASKECASHVVFNGREGALVERPLMTKQDDTIRLFVGNAGPNLISSFHVIGTIFDKVYREGDVVSHPARNVQTTLIPAGGSTIVEMDMNVSGNFTLVDHSINRIDKGAVGFIKVKGKPRPDIYDSLDPLVYCPGCKVHN